MQYFKFSKLIVSQSLLAVAAAESRSAAVRIRVNTPINHWQSAMFDSDSRGSRPGPSAVIASDCHRQQSPMTSQ
jgi:hypothetical protein